jgi:hypothetical protein
VLVYKRATRPERSSERDGVDQVGRRRRRCGQALRHTIGDQVGDQVGERLKLGRRGELDHVRTAGAFASSLRRPVSACRCAGSCRRDRPPVRAMRRSPAVRRHRVCARAPNRARAGGAPAELVCWRRSSSGVLWRGERSLVAGDRVTGSDWTSGKPPLTRAYAKSFPILGSLRVIRSLAVRCQSIAVRRPRRARVSTRAL